MSNTFTCGFECVDTPDATGSGHWKSIVGTPVTSTGIFRTGARSMRFNTTASTSVIVHSSDFSPFTTNHHIGRVYIYFATLPSANCALVRFGLADTLGPQVYYDTGGRIVSGVGLGAGLGATPVNVTTGQWYRIDYDFNVNTSGADFCDVYVDGKSCGQATGAGTSTGNTIDSFGIINTCTADIYMDDVSNSQTAADYPIGGGTHIDLFVSTSDGTHNIAGTGDFQRGNSGTDILNATTTAYQLIDDVPLPLGTVDEADCARAVAPPNATDYVETVFGPAPGVSTPIVPPRSVEVLLAYHQIATQSGNIRVAVNDNGTVDDVLNLTAAGQTVYRYARKHYALAPTGGAWTLSGAGNFNNLRCRFYSSDAAPDQCLDGIMIEAEFPSPVEVLLATQELAVDTTTDVSSDPIQESLAPYQVSSIVEETASTVVTRTLSSHSAEGETPQQQVVVESQGGGDEGRTNISPGIGVDVSIDVTGASTDVGITGSSKSD